MTPILCSIEGMTGIPTMSGCASTIERYRKVPTRSDFTILSRVVIWLVLSRIEGLLYRWSLNYICQWKAVLHWQLQYPERACKEFGAIHCVFPARNAVVAATEVEEIVDAQWEISECLRHCGTAVSKNKAETKSHTTGFTAMLLECGFCLCNRKLLRNVSITYVSVIRLILYELQIFIS